MLFVNSTREMGKFIQITQKLGRKYQMTRIENAKWPFPNVKFIWNYWNELAHSEKPISLSLPFLTHNHSHLSPSLSLSLLFAGVGHIRAWTLRTGEEAGEEVGEEEEAGEEEAGQKRGEEKRKKKKMKERWKRRREKRKKIKKGNTIISRGTLSQGYLVFFQKLGHLPFWTFKIDF